MFTGIIEEVGVLTKVRGTPSARSLTIAADEVIDSLQIGDSIAINGVCQTVTSFTEGSFTVETLAESLKKSNLSLIAVGGRVNLERALTPQSRMGGHFVQGHVNGTAYLSGIRKTRDNIYLSLRLDPSQLPCCIREGSIALDGISLTIAEIDDPSITLNIISHTYEHTTLQYRKPGDLLNVETDMLGRYVERILSLKDDGPKHDGPGKSGTLSLEKLKELGF